MTQSRSPFSKRRATSSGSMPLPWPSRRTTSTPALWGSNSATSWCLIKHTNNVYKTYIFVLKNKEVHILLHEFLYSWFDLSMTTLGMQSFTWRTTGEGAYGKISWSTNEPTMRWISESPRCLACSIALSVWAMASLTYRPCRSISPGLLSC